MECSSSGSFARVRASYGAIWWIYAHFGTLVSVSRHTLLVDVRLVIRTYLIVKGIWREKAVL